MVLRDMKYGNAEKGIDMCFIGSLLLSSQYVTNMHVHANKQQIYIKLTI